MVVFEQLLQSETTSAFRWRVFENCVKWIGIDNDSVQILLENEKSFCLFSRNCFDDLNMNVNWKYFQFCFGNCQVVLVFLYLSYIEQEYESWLSK